MKRNTELLERTMQFLIDHPELHKQEHWISKNECGTVGCFFGWACLLSGRLFKELPVGSETCHVWKADNSTEGQRVNVSDEAQRLLGLTHGEAYDLSRGTNTREMLQLMVKDLVNGDELHAPTYYRKAVVGQQQ
jgi:hypothetical protein